MKSLISFLLALLLFVVIDIPVTPSHYGVAIVIAPSTRVYFNTVPEVQHIGSIGGWFVQGTELKVIDDSGALWLVHGAGIQFDGRAARMTGWVNPEALSLLMVE